MLRSIPCMALVLAITVSGDALAYSEIALNWVGANLWDVSIRSDQDTSGGVQFATKKGVTMAFAALCDGVTNFCFEVPGDGAGVGVLGTLYIGVASVAAAPGPFGGGSPVLLGQLTTSGPLAVGVNNGEAYANGPDIIEVFGVDGSLLPGVTNFVVTPEPMSLGLLGGGLAGLALLRRVRSAR